MNAQRVKSKRVDEATFYSLIQYFAIVLFECHDCDDFSPAKSLMNMCFTFYHESEYRNAKEIATISCRKVSQVENSFSKSTLRNTNLIGDNIQPEVGSLLFESV